MSRKDETAPGAARGRQKADTDVSRPLSEGDTFLPDERDEAPGTRGPGGREGTGSREMIRQAERDVARGLRDSDLRGTPSNVPTSEPVPQESPGALVPEGEVEQIDRRDRIDRSTKSTRDSAGRIANVPDSQGDDENKAAAHRRGRGGE
ncbi:hypothetical protein [Propionivibrio soli]|uniref:hypothetical protein n=1 Tax=Propionivibrio soli TaxID=2976531 RepID=UPI0021E74270|nr:hypothetical protein [Propionivibrio soli]